MALLQTMTCNLRHPTSLRHPVPMCVKHTRVLNTHTTRTQSLAHFLTYRHARKILTHELTHSLGHSFVCTYIQTHIQKHARHSPTYALTHILTYSRNTHNHSLTHWLTHSHVHTFRHTPDTHPHMHLLGEYTHTTRAP